MATTEVYKLEGLKELEVVLLEIGNEFCYDKTARRFLIPALKEAMKPVFTTMKSLIPYDEKNTHPVHMKDNLKISGRQPNAKDKRSEYSSPNDIAIALVGVKTDRRAISQEFGNARVPAQPYMRISLQYASNAVVDSLATIFKKRLEKYKSKKVK